MQKLPLVLGLVATLGLLATSVYAQPGPGLRNEVGVTPPTVRADTPRESAPSMPQPGIQRQEPQFIGGPQPSVSGGNGPPTGCNASGGNCTGVTAQPSVSQIIALPVPSVTMYNGVGPLPANDVKSPTSVGASQSGAQARAETKSERQTKNETERMAAAIVASELVILYNTIPSVGVPPPTVRAEMPREAIPLPANDAKAPNSVGALLGSGENGGNVGLTASQNSLTGVITVTGPNGETRESCGMDACNPPPTPTPPPPTPSPSPVKQRAQAQPQAQNEAAQKALALAGGGSIGGNVAATGVSTPMPPMPGNDAKGPTSVGATGLATPLPRGVGPTPLKNDDVGANPQIENQLKIFVSPLIDQ